MGRARFIRLHVRRLLTRAIDDSDHAACIIPYSLWQCDGCLWRSWGVLVGGGGVHLDTSPQCYTLAVWPRLLNEPLISVEFPDSLPRWERATGKSFPERYGVVTDAVAQVRTTVSRSTNTDGDAIAVHNVVGNEVSQNATPNWDAGPEETNLRSFPMR